MKNHSLLLRFPPVKVFRLSARDFTGEAMKMKSKSIEQEQTEVGRVTPCAPLVEGASPARTE